MTASMELPVFMMVMMTLHSSMADDMFWYYRKTIYPVLKNLRNLTLCLYSIFLPPLKIEYSAGIQCLTADSGQQQLQFGIQQTKMIYR